MDKITDPLILQQIAATEARTSGQPIGDPMLLQQIAKAEASGGGDATSALDTAADVGGQGVRGFNKGLVNFLTLPYQGLKAASDEAAERMEAQGYTGMMPGARLPAVEEMSLYKPFLEQPEAETTAGRYAGKVGEVLGGSSIPAAGMMRAASKLPAATPAVQSLADRFLRPIAQRPGQATAIDVASSAGAGTAQQATEDLGGGPGAQGIAGMAGGFAAPFSVPLLARGGHAVFEALPKIRASADGGMPPVPAQNAATQMIADQLTRAGVTAEQLEQRLATGQWARTMHTTGKAQDATVLADLDESLARLLGSAVRQQPEAANTARNFLQARQTGLEPEQPLHMTAGIPTRQPMSKDVPIAGQHDRVRDALKRAFRISDKDFHGHAANANRTDDQLAESARELSKPAYEDTYKAGALVDLRPKLQPIVDKWAVRAAEAPHTEAAVIRRGLREFAPSGQAVRNIKVFDKAKQFTDSAIKPYFEGVGDKKNPYLGGVLTEMKNELLGAVDSLPTVGAKYQKARGIFSSHAESRRTLQMGRDAFNEEADVGVDAFKGLVGREQQKLFRLGYLGAYEKKSASLPAGADRTKLFGSPRQQELLANIIERTETKLGRARTKGGQPLEFTDRPQRFGGYLAEESKGIRTKEIVSGNSKTAERMADDLAFDTLHKFIDVFKDPRLLSIGKRGFEYALNKTFGMSPDISASIAQQLLTANPAARQAVLNNLRMRLGKTRFQRFSELMGEHQRRAFTGTVGSETTTTQGEQ